VAKVDYKIKSTKQNIVSVKVRFRIIANKIISLDFRLK